MRSPPFGVWGFGFVFGFGGGVALFSSLESSSDCTSRRRPRLISDVAASYEGPVEASIAALVNKKQAKKSVILPLPGVSMHANIPAAA